MTSLHFLEKKLFCLTLGAKFKVLYCHFPNRAADALVEVALMEVKIRPIAAVGLRS